MSEQGWRDFLNAEDLQDWVVLHGGPTAVFKTKSFSHASKLFESISELAGLDGTKAQVTIVAECLTVRLTREVWNIEASHIGLARSISSIAESLGAEAEPSKVQEVHRSHLLARGTRL